ncbi:MAG: SDR family oxidoreductase [Candidatus Omnitrophica bacterium]|nr:SDR family oxidoreductase [Candidatus Omnitrophota bacterium]
MNIEFQNKIVLVTGSTRGIGRQIAEDFGKSGAQLILTGTQQRQIDQLNARAKKLRLKRRYYCVDFSSRESLRTFLKEIEQYKRIDVCVNNAGINRLNEVDRTKEEDWDDMIEVNLRAPFMLIRQIGKQMKKQRYGRIINISSIFGIVSREKRSIYTTTKSGLHGLTVAAALELAKYNVLVNTVSPGFTRTDLTNKNLSKEDQKEIARQVPMQRFGNTQDISKVVLFCASVLNTYMTGQNIIVDGGFICA